MKVNPATAQVYIGNLLAGWTMAGFSARIHRFRKA